MHVESDAQQWAEGVVGRCELGDKRRTRRLVTMVAHLASHVGSSPYAAFRGDEAGIEGAYRLLRNDAVEPEAVASLSPLDLRHLGLKPGEMVTVETRRSRITLKVRQDPDVPEGMVFIPFCFAEAAANRLTNPQLDPFGKIPGFKACAAKVTPTQTTQAAE